MTAGIAAIRPKAVANNASAIPGATTAKLVFFVIPIAWKLFIMPQTVPNNPTKGAADPNDAKKIIGKTTKYISKILGYEGRDEIIHKDDLLKITL